MARIKTRFTGVYTRELDNNYQGHPDICYDITYKDALGKKVWAKVGKRSEGVTAALAMQVRTDLVLKSRHGELAIAREKQSPQAVPTLTSVWTEYQRIHFPCIRPKSREAWCCAWPHLSPISKKTLDAISKTDLKSIWTRMLGRGLSAQTIRLSLQLVRVLYNRALDWGMYSGISPMCGFSLPKVDNTRMRYLTQEECVRLLDALRRRSSAAHAAALISLHTGMRSGEVLALTAQRIDFNTGLITVLDAKAGSRQVVMTSTIADMLRRLCAEHPEGPLFWGSKQHSPLHSLDQTFRRAVAECGFNEGVTDRRLKVTFHTLRHTFASWQAQRGVPLQVIASLLGHAGIAMSQRYAKLAPSQSREAMAGFEAALTVSFDHESSSCSVPQKPEARNGDNK